MESFDARLKSIITDALKSEGAEEKAKVEAGEKPESKPNHVLPFFDWFIFTVNWFIDRDLCKAAQTLSCSGNIFVPFV